MGASDGRRIRDDSGMTPVNCKSRTYSSTGDPTHVPAVLRIRSCAAVDSTNVVDSATTPATMKLRMQQYTNGRSTRTRLLALLLFALVSACDLTDPVPVMRPQTVVLFATPKIIPDFDAPEAAVAAFLDHYSPLTSRADRTILIYAVGNSDHILNYGGPERWDEKIEWARLTDGFPVDDRVMHYDDIDRVVRAFKTRAAELDLDFRIYDQIDSSNEFTITNQFKYVRHPECMDLRFHSYHVGARLQADTLVYATAPNGTPTGKLCGDFLVDQVAAYLEDLGFDGILYGNQLGTRGRWLPNFGPGWSDEEAESIRHFLSYSAETLEPREIMWFDSYNNVRVERDVFSFPDDGYQYFDYLIASGFCVVTETNRYLDNLRSKLRIAHRPPLRVLATLDYVDPWYSYASRRDFALESLELERIAIWNRHEIDGIVFFANDDEGAPVPRDVIERFAERFYR